MPRTRVSHVVLAFAATSMAACLPTRTRGSRTALTVPPAAADSVHSTDLVPGARLHTLVNVQAPWRAYVLDVDLTCTSLRAVKGSATAVGRTSTSALLAALPASEGAIAAINADFFAFTPPGVPSNLHVEDGVLISGPGGKPVLTVRGGRAEIDSVTVRGRLRHGAAGVPITAWNRPAAGRVGVVDAHWGVPLDTVVRGLVWRLEPVDRLTSRKHGDPARLDARYVVRMRTAADTLARGDTLLLHQPTRGRTETLALREGDTVHVQVGLVVRDRLESITEAVGGRPILLADSTVAPDVETEGNAGFRGLNPRSLIGLDRQARRAWLVVVDGRKPGYSMGTTLRQSAELLRALGATHGLNLDGGGSSALVVRGAGETAVRVVNRPSDPVERPVGNALAVYSNCRPR